VIAMTRCSKGPLPRIVTLLLLSCVGCRERSSLPAVQSPEPAPSAESHAIEAPPGASSVASPTPTSPPPPSPSVPAAPIDLHPARSDTPAKTFSPKEALHVLVDSRFASLTPSEAKQKLAGFGEVHETPVDASGSMDVYMDTSSPRFLVSYVRDSVGAWAFMKARATVGAPNVSGADAIYRDYEGALRKRFGKPAWVNDNGPPPPIKGWSIGDGMLEVSLTQRTNDVQGTLVELELIEPQGEAE
jgi:hypothetical protein